MIEIKTFEFSGTGIKDINKQAQNAKIKWASNWPIIYILNDDSEAYVGESYNAEVRFKTHIKTIAKKDLKQINIIIDDEANKSCTLDVESYLIRYMSADTTFKLLNGNHGLVNCDYFEKEKYHLKFKNIIWPELLRLKLAKKTLQQIENSDLFKFSPYTSLSIEQYEVIEDILRVLALNENKKGSIVVEGGPGTGKTLLAVYLMKFLSQNASHFDDDEVRDYFLQTQTFIKKIGLVIPQASLRKTLKKVFSNISGLNEDLVLSPNDAMKDNYDLLIVDESHRLRRRKNLANYKSHDDNNRNLDLPKDATEIDWIMKKSKYQIFLYDENQSVRPTDITPELFLEITQDKMLGFFELTSQFRVKGGNDYIKYVRAILESTKQEKIHFENYDVKLFTNFSDMFAKIKEKNAEFGLCRIISGYGWKWQSRQGSLNHDIEIDGIKLPWNIATEDWVNSKDSINEVGCIHTIQGYDLNYAGVIFGPEISYDEINKKIIIIPKNYHDVNGKKGVKSQEELDMFLKNIYGVLLTRAIRGTYIYAFDKKLEKYLQSFFDSI